MQLRLFYRASVAVGAEYTTIKKIELLFQWKYHLKDTETMLPIVLNPNGLPYIGEIKGYSELGYVHNWQFMEKYIISLPYGYMI